MVAALGALVVLAACGGGESDGGATAPSSVVTVASPATVEPPSPPSTTASTAATPSPTTGVSPPPSTSPSTESTTTSASPPPAPVPSVPFDSVRPIDDGIASPEIVAVLPATLRSPADPPRVLIAGDSTGTELAVRLGAYADSHPGEIVVFHSAFAGCGLSAGNDGRLHAWNTPTEWIDLAGCTLQWQAIPQLVLDDHIDVVIAAIGPWDGTDIMFPDGRIVNVLDPEGHQLVADAYAQFVASVRSAGATPVFIRPATIDAEWERRTDPIDDPRRWDVMREIVDSVGAAQIDLPAWLAANGLEGPAGRPDGVHLAEDVELRFIVEEIVPESTRLAVI